MDDPVIKGEIVNIYCGAWDDHAGGNVTIASANFEVFDAGHNSVQSYREATIVDNGTPTPDIYGLVDTTQDTFTSGGYYVLFTVVVGTETLKKHNWFTLTGIPVPEAILSQFAALDARYVNAAGDTVTGALTVSGALTAKTGRAATLVVAANDSSAIGIAQADYTCDGTDDEVQIQAAIDAAEAASGGMIKLLEGEYSIAATLDIAGSVSIAGMSPRDTILTVQGGGNGIEISSSFVSLRDFRLRAATAGSGTGIKITGGSRNCLIENIWIGTWFGAASTYYFEKGIEVIDASEATYNNFISNCKLLYNTTGVHIGAYSDETYVKDCMIIGGATGVYVGSANCKLVNNWIELFTSYGIDIAANYIHVNNNHIEANGVQKVRLNSGATSCYISENRVDWNAGGYVEDNSGNETNRIEDWQMIFERRGLYPFASAYGGRIYLSQSSNVATDLLMESILGDLQLKARATGKVVDLQSNTEIDIDKNLTVRSPLLFTPVGGFGRQAENLLVRSEEFDHASWTKSNITATANGATSPNGRATADKLELTAASGYVSQQITSGVSDADSMRFSIWLKADETLENTRIALIGNGGVPYVLTTVTLTSEWRRFHVTATKTSGVLHCRIFPLYGADSGYIYAWGAQLISGSNNTEIPYIKTVGSTISVDSPALIASDSIVGGGDINASGDIAAAGGFKQPFIFTELDVAASQSAVEMQIQGTPDTSNINTYYVMPFAGSVIGISVASNTPRTAGTLTVDATINGSVTGLTAVLNADNPQWKATTQAKDTDAFTAGQRIGVRITTDAGWLPVTADIVVTVIVEM